MLNKFKSRGLWVALIGAGAMVSETFFGYQIGEGTVNALADGAAAIAVVWGIFANHN